MNEHDRKWVRDCWRLWLRAMPAEMPAELRALLTSPIMEEVLKGTFAAGYSARGGDKSSDVVRALDADS